MIEDLRFDRSDDAALPPSEYQFSQGDREPVRLIAVSSKTGVTTMIHTLHLKGVARADEWSALQPEPMTGKWMSVVTKYIRLE